MLIKTKTSIINFSNVTILEASGKYLFRIEMYAKERFITLDFKDEESRNAAFTAIFEALQEEKKLIDISDYQ